MANNRMYIECTGCEKPDLFYLAKRMKDGYYGPERDPSGWFDKHKHCGGSHDHFKLSYECPENYDTDLASLIAGKLNSPLFRKV
jgi:hypothetical protein